MLFHYFPENDMVYIILIDGVSTESEEIARGVVLDFAANNRLVGVEVEDASMIIDLTCLEPRSLPLADLIMSARTPA